MSGASEAAAEEPEWLVRGRSLVPGVATKAVAVVQTFQDRVEEAGNLKRDIQHFIEKVQKSSQGAYSVVAPALRDDLVKLRERQGEQVELLAIEASAAMRAIAAYLGFSYSELGHLAKEEAKAKQETK